MAEVTTMVLKVDLQCCKCYKKVKKVLCKFPQIRDQVYDEKQNTVTIQVACCCPEKMNQKIFCRGGKSVKSIEIKIPVKENPPEPPHEKQKAPPGNQKPPPGKQQPPPGNQVPSPGKQQPPPGNQVPSPGKQQPPPGKQQPPPGNQQPHCKQINTDPPASPKNNKPPDPTPRHPPCDGYRNPFVVCCRECCKGHGGGPCQQLGYFCRPPCYCGCYGRPVFDSWGGCNRGYSWSRCELYCEENPSACSIM